MFLLFFHCLVWNYLLDHPRKTFGLVINPLTSPNRFNYWWQRHFHLSVHLLHYWWQGLVLDNSQFVCEPFWFPRVQILLTSRWPRSCSHAIPIGSIAEFTSLPSPPPPPPGKCQLQQTKTKNPDALLVRRKQTSNWRYWEVISVLPTTTTNQ